MKRVYDILFLLILFPLTVWGQKDTLSCFKIPSSTFKHCLEQKIEEGIKFYAVAKMDGVTYGYLYFRDSLPNTIVKIFTCQYWRYFCPKPTWGVIFLKKIPIFLVGEVNCHYVKRKKKTVIYELTHNEETIWDPYYARLRLIPAKNKKKQK